MRDITKIQLGPSKLRHFRRYIFIASAGMIISGLIDSFIWHFLLYYFVGSNLLGIFFSTLGLALLCISYLFKELETLQAQNIALREIVLAPKIKINEREILVE